MHLRLYVGRAEADVYERQVQEICRLIGEECEIEVVDAIDEPERAESDHVIATPTLIKLDPPARRVIGGLAEAKRIADYMTAPDA